MDSDSVLMCIVLFPYSQTVKCGYFGHAIATGRWATIWNKMRKQRISAKRNYNMVQGQASAATNEGL